MSEPLPEEIAGLIEILDHFASNDWLPGEDWAFPDDNSSLCLDHRLPDGTKFWLDIEKTGVMIMWHRPDKEAQVIRLVDASALGAPPEEIAGLIEELSCTEGPGGPFVLPVICQEAAAALRALALENERLAVQFARLPLNDREKILMGRLDKADERIHELEAELVEFAKLKEYAKSLGQQTYLEIHAENERLKKAIRELEALAKCDGCGKPLDENGGICEPCHSASISGHIKPLGERIRELEAERDWLAKRSNDLQTLANTFARERDAIRAKTFKECAEAIEAKHCDLTSTTAGWIIRALAQTDEGKT